MEGQARFLSSSFRAGAAIGIFILGTTWAFAQKDGEARPNLTTTPAVPQNGVLLYKPFEIRLSTTTSHGNPYHDVSLTGVFTSPSGRQRRLKGFWNGGRNWVVRFSPTEAGSWAYRTESSDGNLVTSGTFEAQSNPQKRGFVRVSPSRRYQFEYSDGTPFLLMGETNWDAMTGGVGFEARFKPFVNVRVSQNFNAFNTMVVQNRYDYQSNEGGPPYEMLNSNTRNYDRLNPGFFQWVDRRVAYADSLGMVSILFFTWAEELRQMPRDAYKRLALYIVSRYAAYNVFWVLAGDYSVYFYDPPLYREVGNAVAEADPYGHPISIHPGDGGSNREFGNDGWLGYVMYQHRDAGEFLADSIRAARIYNKPVVNAEYGYHLPNYVHAHGIRQDAHYTRTGGWMIFNAGGYFVSGFEHTYYDPDEHYTDELDTSWDLNNPQDLEAGRQHTVFYRFFRDHTSWWELDPRPDLARPGGPLDGQTELLAKPGSEYVAYNVRGGRMRLQLPANQYFSLAWFDPVAGALQPGRAFQSTGEAVLLMPASNSDAAALLRAAAPPSVIAAGGVTNLQSQQLNIRQARFTWQTPEPSDSRLDLQKPDGSRVQYLDNRETTQHEIIVDGLLPDVNYTATVASQTADRREWKSSPISLRTSVVVMDQWIEAESMPTKTVGRAEPPGWNLNADGHLAISLNFPQSGPYRFVVRSRSEHRNGWPNLALQVDNSTLANVSINSAVFKTFTVERDVNAGTRQVKLTFTNHFEDRQLIVDWLHVQFMGATETQPPIISNVTATNITSSSARITWSTDEPADSQVEYGLNTNYGSFSALDPARLTSHAITLTGLAGNTTYHYRVNSKDAAGNLAVSPTAAGGNFTFTTLPDVTPPVISNVTAINITPGTATITWNTDEASDSQVEYGTDTNYGTVSPLDVNRVTAHSVTISGLAATTTYHYRVKSKDATGNLAVSGNFTFTTSSPAPAFEVTLEAESMPVKTSGSERPPGWGMWGNGYLAQTVNFPRSDTYRFTLRAYGSFAAGDWSKAELRINQTARATISVNTSTYAEFTAMFSVNAGSQEVAVAFINDIYSPPDDRNLWVDWLKIQSGGTSDTQPPVISNVAAGNITVSSATISWATNEASDRQVEYGLTTSYGSSSALNTTLLTSHSVTLSNLQANTTYNYRVKSKDAAGNLAVSGNFTFTTLPDVTPPVISNVNSTNITTTTATINWSTDEASDSQVEYGLDTNYGSTSALEANLVLAHSVALSGLTANTTYHYRVKSKDAAGNLAVSSNFTFTTSSPAPAFEVTLEAERMPVKTSGSERPPGWGMWGNGYLAQTVTFPRTDTYRFTLRAYGSFAAGDWSKAELRINQVARATISVNTSTYTEFTAMFSVNAGSQEVTVAFINDIYSPPDDRNLWVDWLKIQSEPSDTQPPVISNVAAGNITVSSTTITWTTDEASDRQVEYGLTTSYGSSSALIATLLTSHSVTLSNLQANTTYNYRVKSKDAAGNLAVSANFTFTTLPDVTPPVISNVNSTNITTTTATINWSTDEASDSQVEYGLDTNYGSTSALDANLVLAHSLALSGLTANTTYHYRVKSKDAAGNLAVSGNFTFTTATAAVVTLNSPNGGEWWLTGANQQITWNGSSSIANVKLEFSRNAGAAWRTIAASTPNNGSYNWQAPDTVSNTCLIRISDAANANLADESDGTFFIAPSALVNFTPSPGNPVLNPGAPGSWDENIRERGWVMYENGVYYMWYGGWQGAYNLSVPQLLKLGYASSTDGINWTKHSANPVHSQNWTEDVVVVKDGNTYYLYAENEYTGDGDGALIDLYTSTDRINWARYGTVLRPSGSGWEAGDVGTPTVWKEGNTWYMLYEGLGAGFAGQVGLATSSDGKNWTRYANNPVLSHANASRDIAIDSIIKINGVYYAYGHYDSGGHDWVGGLFTSTNLTSWTAYPDNPIVYNSPVIVDAGAKYYLYGLTSSSMAPYHVALSPITNDITPPLISNVAANGITTSAATISWTTDEASDSQVEYGLTTSYGASTSLNPALVTSHAGTLSGLQPNTTYHYRVKSKDAAGNLAVSGNFTFTTAPPTPAFEVTLEAESMPVKTGGSERPPGWGMWGNGYLAQTVTFPRTDTYRFTLRAYGSFAAGDWSKAELRINQTARAVISVNTSTYAEFTATFSVNAGSQEVAVAFINDIYSPPDDRNLWVDWLKIQSGPSDTQPPVISNVAAGNITVSSTTITWTTDEASDRQVEYGLTTSYGSSSALNSALLTSHSVTLSNLQANTTYNYRVKSKDAAGNLAVSANFTFTTLPDVTPPVISNVNSSNITTAAATINWSTDEASDSQVEYGLDTNYGSTSALDANRVTSHSVALAGLTANTTYHYRVKSKDAAGNLAISGNFTFTTAPPAPAFEVTLEAENMPIKTSGGSRPPVWALWNNGHLAQTVNFPSSGSYRFTLRAYASFAAGDWSKAELRLNQAARAVITVNSPTLAEFTVTFSVNAGSQEVAIAFINDLYSPPDDRNLYVDWLRIQSAGAATAAAVSDDADGKIAPSSVAKEFIHQDETIPGQLALQAYPNPLQASAFSAATIVLALPQRAEIELHVFDTAGRRVHEWPAGAYPAGHHELIWNGRNREGQGLGAGVYFLRLRYRPENTAAWSHVVRRVLIVK